jgi:hypothetical protein
VRQGKPFVHYGKDLETVHKISATFLDRSIFIGAFAGDNLIGFAKLFTDEARTYASVMHIVAMMQHRDKAPTNGLIAQAVRSCADRGFQHLVYSNFSYGNKLRDSLSDFKKNNGFARIEVPRYYAPLTQVGRVALHLGLHKRLADWIPEPILARLRDARNSWYNRKLQSVTEAS